MAQNNKSNNQTTPDNLPILDEEKFEIHTMQDDLKRREKDSLKDNTGLSDEPKQPKKRTESKIFSKKENVSPFGDKKSFNSVSNTKSKSTINPEDIKIPSKTRSNIIILAGSVFILLLLVALGVFYWYSKQQMVKDNKKPQDSEVTVSIPAPKVENVQQPKPKEEVVEKQKEQPKLPEPTQPEPVLAFQNLQIIEVKFKDKNAFLNQIKQREIEIPGSSVITRYLFKVSNEKEKRFITNKELFNLLQVNLPIGVWNYIENVDFISYKIGNDIRYGFIAKINNKKALKSELDKVSANDLIDDFKVLYMGNPLVVPQNPKFSENKYLNFDKVYINLPKPTLSLDIALSDKYFVVATSKDMIYAVLVFASEGNTQKQPEKTPTSQSNE